MKQTYFQMIGQPTGDGKVMIIAVMDESFFEHRALPPVFEIQCLKLPKTIYTGTYPQIKLNIDSIKERRDLIGLGIGGIATEPIWYCETKEIKDDLGISIE